MPRHEGKKNKKRMTDDQICCLLKTHFWDLTSEKNKKKTKTQIIKKKMNNRNLPGWMVDVTIIFQCEVLRNS